MSRIAQFKKREKGLMKILAHQCMIHNEIWKKYRRGGIDEAFAGLLANISQIISRKQ